MKIKDQVVLTSSCELRVFYYNNDPNFPNHETEQPDIKSEYTIMGYVLDNSNSMIREEKSENLENYAYVIRHNTSAELFRVDDKMLSENFRIL